MSIYYRMYWCRRLRRRLRHWSIALSYQISMTVSCWKIINYSLLFECELTLLFFLCKQFNLTFCYCSLLIVKMIFRVGHLFECQLLEIFKVWHFFNAVYQKELLMTYLFKSFPGELIWYQGMLYIIMLILNYFEFLFNLFGN